MAEELHEYRRLGRTPKGYRARGRILTATAEVLGERGVDNLSVMIICDRANISRTSLYNYFKDVNQVLQALTQEVAEEIQAQFEIIHGNQPRARRAWHFVYALCWSVHSATRPGADSLQVWPLSAR